MTIHVDHKQIIIEEKDLELKRLDKILANRFPEFSRTQIQNFFENGLITLDNSTNFSLNKTPKIGSQVFIAVPPPIDYQIKAEAIPLDILYEDEDIIFINKKAGMCVHPAAGNWNHTLVHALLYHCPNLSGIGNEKRPGIVHRLDKGTSGVMIAAKSQKAHKNLIECFKKHELIRIYQTLTLKRNIPPKGVIESFIDRSKIDRKKMTSNKSHGKKAITHYDVQKVGNKIMHLKCRLETGRTHQIRVHLSEVLQIPILNDYVYGNPKQHLHSLPPQAQQMLKDYPYPMLHAQTLGLKHPLQGHWLEFSSAPPSPFADLLELFEQSEL